MTGISGSKHQHQLQVKKGAVRLERHSGSGNYGSPKKEGFGGWGKVGEEFDGVDTIDPKDPNYDDDAHAEKLKDRQSPVHSKPGEKATIQEKAK